MALFNTVYRMKFEIEGEIENGIGDLLEIALWMHLFFSTFG
jgi:hypothetical protein